MASVKVLVVVRGTMVVLYSTAVDVRSEHTLSTNAVPLPEIHAASAETVAAAEHVADDVRVSCLASKAG